MFDSSVPAVQSIHRLFSFDLDSLAYDLESRPT